MLLYHKIYKYSIFIFALVFVLIFNNSASATQYDLIVDVPEAPAGLMRVQVNTDTRYVASSSVFDETNNCYILTFDVPLTVNIYKRTYSSFLYFNGSYQFALSFLPLFNRPILASSIDYEVDTFYNNNSSYGIIYSNNYQRNVVNTTYFAIYLDNHYCDKTVHSLCQYIVNYKITVALSSLSNVNDFYLTLDNLSYSTINYSLATSVQPSAIHGLAFTISEAVSRSIYNSSIEEDLSGIHTDIEATNLILSQIKQQDLSLYNQIIQTIVNQTQNDNALQQAFISYLTNQLHGEGGYYDPYLGQGQFVSFNGPIGEICSLILEQIADIRIIFTDYIHANRQEASEVNSEAQSQEQALNELESQLSIPQANIDTPLEDLSDLATTHQDTASDLFFYLRNSLFVQILVIVTSLGLVGFILYGRG